MKNVIEQLALGCRKLYRTEQFPNSLIKFNWNKFVADRHAIGPGFGWKICNARFPSGVTPEHRNSWSTNLYVKSDERFWTLGENSARITEIKEIKQDKKFGKTAELRKEVAFGKLGDLHDVPLLGWVLQKFPELAEVRFVVPIFHSRSHITVDWAFHTVAAMQKWEFKICQKLITAKNKSHSCF